MPKNPLHWLAALPLAATLACDGGPDAQPPEPASRIQPASRILLVTLDTTRADRLGAYGHEAAQTPTLDALAREGVLFEAAVAPAPLTLPSHASILTGVYPPAHGVRDNGLFALAPEAELISEVFQRRGWRTGAFVGSYVLNARFGLAQGFEVYRGPAASRSALLLAERPADAVVGDAIGWLGSLAPGDSFFAWVHLMDPHWPYAPPEPWKSRFADPYDGEIAFCDAQLARLLGFLRERGLDAGLLTAVTADHGEALGEHAEPSHGVFLYQGALRVPLILHGPGLGVARGVRRPGLVSNADLAPTLLALAGLPAGELPATSLPALPWTDAPRGAAEEDGRAVYVESLLPYFQFRWHALRGLLWRGHKLIEGRSDELYALAEDPRELSDLAGAQPEQAREMRRRLRELLDRHPPLGWVQGHALDARERALLASLGYAEASPGAEDPFGAELPDAREHLEEEQHITRVRALIQQSVALREEPPAATAWRAAERRAEERRVLEEARDLLIEMERRYPRNPQLGSHRGYVELALGNPEQAIRLLERAIAGDLARDLRSATTHQHLAMAYLEAGRAEDAAREMERAIALDPGQGEHYEWLVGLHVSQQQYGRAARWLERRLELGDPDPGREAGLRSDLAKIRAAMGAAAQATDPPPPGP